MLNKVFKLKSCKTIEERSLEELKRQRITLIGMLIFVSLVYFVVMAFMISEGEKDKVFLIIILVTSSVPSIELMARVNREIKKRRGQDRRS